MELVGKALKYRPEEVDNPKSGLRVIFRCQNKMVFDLKVAPAIDRIPPDTLVRAWTQRLEDEAGNLLKDNVLTHWEVWE